MTEFAKRVLSRFLCIHLCFSASAWCQEPVFIPGATPASQVQPAQSPVRTPESMAKIGPGLRIIVLEGRLKVNRLTEGSFAMPVVEVRDNNDKPIEGARVTFVLSGGPGAGATFQDGSLEKTFSSNAQGQAAAEGYRPNNIEGKFNVRVKASYQDESTEVVIAQANSFQLQVEADRKQSRAWRKWVYIGGAAAAGTVAAVLLLNRGGSSTPSVISVTPGPPVFGGR